MTVIKNQLQTVTLTLCYLCMTIQPFLVAAQIAFGIRRRNLTILKSKLIRFDRENVQIETYPSFLWFSIATVQNRKF